ncbi:MAG: sulfurtransferase [Burkholderiaceae bacterium]
MTVQPAVHSSTLNIAAYRFVALDEPGRWVSVLRERCRALRLKGTIIVATEGINLFLAGSEETIDSFLEWLAGDPRFVDCEGGQAFSKLDVKRSWSDTAPFRRLRVKHKPEIVTMRRPCVVPAAAARAPAIAPERLSAWLAQGHDDEGREVVLLDTRNAFEFEQGTFDGARHLDLARFEAFPDAVEGVRDALHGQTVVTFCTGGIRCEKAALHMRDIGFMRVLQLDGGILNYFDKVGGAHWSGECFVFDERVALDAELKGHTAQ